MNTKKAGYFDIVIQDIEGQIINPTPQKVAHALKIDVADWENLKNDGVPKIKTLDKVIDWLYINHKGKDPKVLSTCKKAMRAIRKVHKAEREFLIDGYNPDEISKSLAGVLYFNVVALSTYPNLIEQNRYKKLVENIGESPTDINEVRDKMMRSFQKAQN